MTPQQLIPILEGFVGTTTGSTGVPQQVVSTWIEMVKYMLRGTDYRDLTDLQFRLVSLITDVGIVVDAAATHLIADLWEISGDLGTDTAVYCGYTDADSDTIDILTALSTQEDVVTVFPVNDLGTASTPEYYPHIYLAGSAGVEATPSAYATTGIALATGLTAWADGKDGNAGTAASIRAFVLYRT